MLELTYIRTPNPTPCGRAGSATENRNPKPSTRNPKPETLYQKPETRNSKPESPKSETLHPQPQSSISNPSIVNPFQVDVLVALAHVSNNAPTPYVRPRMTPAGDGDLVPTLPLPRIRSSEFLPLEPFTPRGGPVGDGDLVRPIGARARERRRESVCV